MAVAKPLLTVIIIAADDGKQETEYRAMEKDVLCQQYNKQVRYIIYKYNTNTDKAVSKYLKQSFFYQNYFKVLDEPEASGRGFYKEETLTNFLKRVNAAEKSPEHKYILLTWGHGAGLGFFATIDHGLQDFLPSDWKKNGFAYYKSKTENALNYISFFSANFSFDTNNHAIIGDRLINILYKELNEKSETTTNDKVLPDDMEQTFREYIYENYKSGIPATVLADIIKQGIGKAEILICMNCFLQMLEVCYVFRDVINIVIGGQKVIPFNGYNYNELFKALNENPKIPGEKVAENITTYFPVKYFETPYFFKDENGNTQKFRLENTSLSAININVCKDIYPILGKLTGFILSLQAAGLGPISFADIMSLAIRPARRLCGDLMGKDIGVIDISFFFEQAIIHSDLLSLDLSEQLSLLYDEFYMVQDTSLISAYLPAKANFPEIDSAVFHYTSPHFASILLPFNNNSPLALQVRKEYLANQVLKNGYFIETGWNKFIPLFSKI